MNELLSLWGYIYTGQAIAFSLCILIIGPMDRHKAFWLLSNAIGASGLFVVSRDYSVLPGIMGMHGSAMVIISGMFKAIALGDGTLLQSRNRFGLGFIVSSLLLTFAGYCVPFDYRLFCIMSGGLAVNLACLFRLIAARRWRGSWARGLMIASLLIATIANNMRLLTAYPFGADHLFFGNTNAQFASVAGVIILSFFMQIAFIGMLEARQSHERLLANRRAARVHERAVNLRAAKRATDKLASERLSMLQLLTHEVRQPLNNAQAALQKIMMQLRTPAMERAAISKVVFTVQNVLDDITLTLTNAITGATLVERKEAISPKPVEVISICRMAVLDCPTDKQSRIHFTHPDESIFAHCDPTLLRLALRNLLDNAVKYSPPDSRVEFRVEFDDAALGLRFKVHNLLADRNSLNGNIFEKGKRGVDRAYDGHGVGLFVVMETARLHFGELCYYQSKPDDVTFEVFLPL